MKRQPIVGVERVPVSSKGLEWDDVYDKFINYIKYASKNVIQTEGSDFYTPEDLFQEGQLILYKCWQKYSDKEMDEFGKIFKASVWRKMRELVRKLTLNCVDIENAFDIGYTDEVVDDIYQNEKLRHLAEMLKDNPIALTILKEFVNPSERTIWEATMEMERKQTLKSFNQMGSAPKTIQPTRTAIQRAMEISKPKFDKYYNDLKEVMMREYFHNAM